LCRYNKKRRESTWRLFFSASFVRENSTFCAALLRLASRRRELRPLYEATMLALLASPEVELRLTGIRAVAGSTSEPATG
jgi:hypothetical protein